jgi:hypothetical protein
MRRRLTRLLLVFGLLLVVSALTIIILLKTTPGWYGQPLAADQSSRFAADAESKVAETQNWAALTHGDSIRTQRATQSRTTAPATRAADTLNVRFTADELNALFTKWSTVYGWNAEYGEHLEDPRIIFQNDRLILAARSKQLGAVASFHFAPTLDQQGLGLKLVSARAGMLPLPETLWASYRQQLVDALTSELPRWQRQARIDTRGAANEAAVSVVLARLLIRAAQNQPGDPILFLPLTDNGKAVPVRLTRLSMDGSDSSLAIQVRALTQTERDQLIQKISASDAEPDPAPPG